MKPPVARLEAFLAAGERLREVDHVNAVEM
jgi:hypothetical protein